MILMQSYISLVTRRNKALIKELSTPPLDSKDLYFHSQYSQSFFTQCTACLWKQHWSYWRNPSYNAVRLLFTSMIAVLFGMIFWDLGSKRYGGKTNPSNENCTKFLLSLKLICASLRGSTGEDDKICSMQWVPCTPPLCFWGYKMVCQCSQLWLLREQCFIEKEQPECILLCRMPLDR